MVPIYAAITAVAIMLAFPLWSYLVPKTEIVEWLEERRENKLRLFRMNDRYFETILTETKAQPDPISYHSIYRRDNE